MSANKKIISLSELFPYLVIGTLATMLDWTAFSIAIHKMGFHYEICLLIGYICGGSFHYITNKFITFKCRSKKLGSQLSIYILMGGISLSLSMGILAILVKGFMLNAIFSRVLTTGIMILPNYLLHKHVTFSKKLFLQP